MSVATKIIKFLLATCKIELSYPFLLKHFKTKINMKKITFSIALVAIGFAGFAQIPEFKNTPMILKADGKLDKLEKQSASIRDKGGSNPFANAYSYGATAKSVQFISITGAESPVKVDPSVKFVFKANDAEVDPEGVFIVYEAVIAKKMREVYVKKDFGRNVKDKEVSLSFEKIQPGVYKITPQNLKPGTEYGIVPNTEGASKIVYLFGTTGEKPKGKKK